MFRLNRTAMAIGALTLGAIGIGFCLVPSHQEIALMQMKDFDFSAAMQNFTALHSEGDVSINVLGPLINLDIYYGEIDKAIALLETYVTQHPHSVEVRKKLAELYKSSQRYNLYCAMLEEVQKLSPSPATLRELADTYSFLGRNQDEMNALARLIDSKGYKPQEDDYIELASFYRVNGQTDTAINLIRDYVRDKDYKVSVDMVYLALQLLLEKGKNEKALALANDYIEENKNDEDAVYLSTLFESRGQFNSAVALVTPFMSIPDHSIALEQQMVDLLLAQKKDDEVYDILSARYAKENILPPSFAVTLTDLAVERDDYDMIEKLINSQDLKLLPEDALLRYTDVAFRLKRLDLAQRIKDKLGPDYLREAPLFAAILEVVLNDTPKSMAALAALADNAVLLPEARIVLANLYLQHNMSQRALAVLDSVPVMSILDVFDTFPYALIYLEAGAAPKAEENLAKVRPASPPDIQATIDQTLLFLAAGEGKTEYVRQQLANFEKNDTWSNAYDFAIQYHRDDIALIIAEQYFKVDPSIPNRLQLADTLLLNHRASDAAGYLRELALTDDAVRSLYLDALVMWVEETGPEKLPQAHKEALLAIAGSVEKNPNASADEKRDLAYVLEGAGFGDQTEAILIALAGDQSSDRPDVVDLIGYWQDHSSNRAREWVENRARKATGADKALWLADLNDLNDPQAVIDIVRNDAKLPPAIADQYIAALVEMHDARLDTALQKEISIESNPARLKNLATIATEEDAESAAENGWTKLLELSPGDSRAQLEMGLVAFNTERYEEAEPLLSEYLQHNTGNYQANYAYAEILQQEEKKEEAKPYYERALQQVFAVKEKNQDVLIDQAYLLYHTGDVPQSIALFHSLLTKNPADKNLRADFAEVLMDAGQYDEAAGLLSQQ